MDDRDFGRHLVFPRLRHGLTQAELGPAAGQSARCISDLGRGINVAPRLATLRRLIDGLAIGKREALALLEVVTCARVRVGSGTAAATNRRGSSRSATLASAD